MSVMIIIEKDGIKDVLITGKSDGEEKDGMKLYNKIEPEINAFKGLVRERLRNTVLPSRD
jgi:hypothetical protein